MSASLKYAAAILALFISISAYAADLVIEDAFSPNQGATELVVKTINEAQESIDVAAYSFTSRPIANALVAAHDRGANVRVVLDKSQNSDHSLYHFLLDNGIATRINSRYAIMHDKFMVIDDRTVELGSFNYTKAAEEKNAENVLVIHGDQSIAQGYAKQWQKLWDEGE